MHLSGGQSPQGDKILSRKSVKAMQARQVRLPKHTRGGIDAWGLGWFLMNWDGYRLYGHDGATLGQYTFMRVLPEKDTAWALLANGGDATGLFNDVCTNVLKPMINLFAQRRLYHQTCKTIRAVMQAVSVRWLSQAKNKASYFSSSSKAMSASRDSSDP
jgi:CubicO group peptidase (beta-lactamase class C family)